MTWNKAKNNAHGEREVYIQSLLKSILDDDVGSGSRPGYFTIGENVQGGR